MTSLMLEEAVSAADCVALQLANDADRCAALGHHLRSTAFHNAVTVARGSSDHASSYLAYLIMARMGRLVTSLPMSLVTLYKAPLQAAGTLAIAVSQSGQSPDVVGPISYFRAGGATTVALVNDIDSPLAQAAEWALPLRAGKEHSVAATKSFITSLTAGARLVAEWQQDAELQDGLAALPDALRRAAAVDWSAALDVLAPARNIMVVGRGICFPVALEAALNLKETSALQAAGTLAIAVSQSGQSPDVVEPISYFRSGGATTVALVNAIDSPLAHAAEWALPLRAGKEHSVAATKSFITSQIGRAHV